VLGRELLQRVGVGRGPGLRLLDRDQPELVEEDAPQLRGGVDVELLPRVEVDLALEPPALVAELLAEILEERDVDADSGRFHVREHGDERAFDPLVEPDELARFQRLSQRVGQTHEHGDAPAGLSRVRLPVEVERALDLIG